MPIFARTSELPAPVGVAAALHERSGGFERLVPPFAPAVIVRDFACRRAGETALIRARTPFGWWVDWEARLAEVTEGHGFVDEQVRGPFASWRHSHRFEAAGADRSTLADRIDWKAPGGPPAFLAEGLVTKHLGRIFGYRHRLTVEDAGRFARLAGPRPLHVLVTGGTGLLGGVLVPWLRLLGHRVTVLGRRPAGPDGVFWNPEQGIVQLPEHEHYDAVVHLAGANVGSRWTEARKAEIRSSRVEGTKLLTETLAKRKNPPAVFVSASGTGFYGLKPRTDGHPWREGDGAGDDFLAQVCVGWENAALPLAEAGCRICVLRLGVVLDPRGGALAKLLPPFLFGVGGPAGTPGAQLGWISSLDAADLLAAALTDPRMSGVWNAVAGSVTQRELSQTLGRVLHRPAFLPAPAWLLRLVFGEMAEGTILADCPVEPARLKGRGWEFRHPDLETALRVLLGR